MKAKVKLNFKIKIDNKIKDFEIGDFVEIYDEEFVNKYSEKGILEIVSIMDTKQDGACKNNVYDNFEDDIIEENVNNKSQNINESKKLYLTLEELKKLKNKDEIIEYGTNIGLEGLNDNYKREELEDMIFEYIKNIKEVENENV